MGFCPERVVAVVATPVSLPMVHCGDMNLYVGVVQIEIFKIKSNQFELI